MSKCEIVDMPESNRPSAQLEGVKRNKIFHIICHNSHWRYYVPYVLPSGTSVKMHIIKKASGTYLLLKIDYCC